MPNFESFKQQTKEAGSSLESIRKITEKFPKLRSLILAFIASTTTFSAAKFTEADNLIVREPFTAEAALDNIDDPKFREIVDQIKTEMSLLSSEIPTNSLYGNYWEHTSINAGETFKQNQIGNLPESATNVFITSEHITGQAITDDMLNSESANAFSSTKSFFYISPTEAGSVIEGEKMVLEGIGETPSEALQNALENSVGFLDMNITNNLESATDIKDNTVLAETIKTSSMHFIKEYKVIHTSQATEKDHLEYRIVIEIISGEYTPEK